MAVEKSNEPETRMERREGNAMPLHRVYNSSILGYPTYRPILPYHMYHFSSMSPHQRQLLERTQSYIRMFCAGLMGFIFVLLMCLSPLYWVRFMVMKDKKKLFAGLWTVCHHDLCWSHVPKAPWFLSGLNHISSRATSPDQNLLVIPITRTRIGNTARVDRGLTETNTT
ncbi:transmembrane protein 202-like isoform X3 [Prionailurus bengalensis]|uniref:transmembrane protein 202-like isoform X3 n=1 Tax=Prionailurus bengalensis TaxID=37029 RepID=UPI001CA8AEF7|nr:transmembrane protein 202-like isoform X3 [Prionailurus bengalensis]